MNRYNVPGLFKTLLLAAFLTAAGTASAGVVTFDSLPGPNGTPFTTVTEDGITVTAESGEWQQAFNVGNPIPSIFTFSDAASVAVTTGGLFNFVSFDLGTGGNAGPAYTVEQFLDGLLVDTFSGQNANTLFHTINSAYAGSVDRVLIHTSIAGLTTSANLDNIRVSFDASVPEPGTLALLGLGLAAFGVRRRIRAS